MCSSVSGPILSLAEHDSSEATMTAIEKPPPATSAAGLRTYGFRMAHPETLGAENIPRAGAAVLAMTHFGHLEFAIVHRALRRQHRRMRFLVRRGADGYADALQALQRGELVGLFPEAGAADSLTLRELKVGAALLAIEADVPLVPVVVWTTGEGTADDGRKHSRLRHGTWAQVSFGLPIPRSRFEDARAVTDELHETLQRMVDQLDQRPAPGVATLGSDARVTELR
jgi:1-acyl-sn-glycerol-3-phosphate acyltransferase